MERTMVLMMGIQGSGKSTFFHRFLADEYVRVNLDTLKTRQQENLFITACIEKGESFAIDNTNPTQADRNRYIPLAKAAGYKIIGYFMESKLKECLERNDLRHGKEKVPAKAVAATSNKLQIPSYDEGFDELYFVSNDGTAMIVSKWRDER